MTSYYYIILPSERQLSYQRIKLVITGFSCSGRSMPASLPALMHLSSHAMFLPSVLMVCMPSASSLACSALPPYTIFQYWDDTTGILAIVKYLLI